MGYANLFNAKKGLTDNISPTRIVSYATYEGHHQNSTFFHSLLSAEIMLSSQKTPIFRYFCKKIILLKLGKVIDLL